MRCHESNAGWSAIREVCPYLARSQGQKCSFPVIEPRIGCQFSESVSCRMLGCLPSSQDADSVLPVRRNPRGSNLPFPASEISFNAQSFSHQLDNQLLSESDASGDVRQHCDRELPIGQHPKHCRRAAIVTDDAFFSVTVKRPAQSPANSIERPAGQRCHLRLLHLFQRRLTQRRLVAPPNGTWQTRQHPPNWHR